MDPGIFYTIAEDKVAHEVIDGEVVVIHFESGSYYSLTGMAAQLWQWLSAGPGRAQIIEALGPLTDEEIESVDGFIDSLLAEGILEKHTGAKPGEALARYDGVFENPTFEKYNDMQNLLLSDPIHDVDEMGWPHLDPDGR